MTLHTEDFPKHSGSCISVSDVLSSYLNYKTIRVPSRFDFHRTICLGQDCACNEYKTMISHFDNCINSNCKICESVRWPSVNRWAPYSGPCLTKGVGGGAGSGSGSFLVVDPGRINQDSPSIQMITEPKGRYTVTNYGDYRVEDTQSTPKRRKIGNVVAFDGWSLGSVVHSALRPPERGYDHLAKPVEGLLPDENSIKNSLVGSVEATTPPLIVGGHSDDGLLSSAIVLFPKTEGHMGTQQLSKEAICTKTDLPNKEVISCQSPNIDSMSASSEVCCIDQGDMLMSEAPLGTKDLKCDTANCEDNDHQVKRKVENSKRLGVSLADFFTSEQIKEHVDSLRKSMNSAVGKELIGGENSCQLCRADGLTFAPLPVYCTICGTRIKVRSNYYMTMAETGPCCCFCTSCFKRSRGDNISFGGQSFSKATLCKRSSFDKSEEAWVQCDKCQRWQHQICALYNAKLDPEGVVSYICPCCRFAQLEAVEHTLINSALGAQDLPRTMLSDHIEKRLFKSLVQERKQRAKLLGKSPEEVPGAEDLVVRVVLAVDKQLKVKQQFLDILHGETYPEELPYRSKMILLFQKIEGVDVCLFAMYVQEFGSECGLPNQRSVYISYLDSVKYFKPDIKTSAGEALRTFVYHEILVGYLDYCKKRGFTTCYIWACPPLKGDDFILYCHPEIQKTPVQKKLRQWYKKMLEKALKDGVVLGYTNFYDYLFVPTKDSKSKITAARLPLFDGDYWTTITEEIIRSLEKDFEGDFQKEVTKRTLRAMGHCDLPDDAKKDILVMVKLGRRIQPVKEDYFVVHLHFTCATCLKPISGYCWSCEQCRDYHLCARCSGVEQSPGELKIHTNFEGEKHTLSQISVNDVAADTKDGDGIKEDDFFENRHSFLTFCQKNHYQFDTLRRAKHSSMMLLYFLHKTTASAMGTICGLCHQDVMVEGHSEKCSKSDVCSGDYQKEGDGCQKLSQNLTGSNFKTESTVSQHHIWQEGKPILDLLYHAHHCAATKDKPCSYPGCLSVKSIFLHGRDCRSRSAGGCRNCKIIWYFIRQHSQNCEDSNCDFPRCRDVKSHIQKITAVKR